MDNFYFDKCQKFKSYSYLINKSALLTKYIFSNRHMVIEYRFERG